MLDYHLHLWPHDRRATPVHLDQLALYCEKAAAAGVQELAVTEHLFRFRQAESLLGGFWDDDRIPPALQVSMAEYWDFHATADLDEYVACALEAKEAGLPIVIGLEVDYYPGRMDDVTRLLGPYPFDVLLGSVHWLGAWRFDDVDVPLQMDEWSTREVDACWEAYPRAGSSGMAAELSSAGWRKPVGEQYPALPLLERFVARGVPLTTASDAHRQEQVADRAAGLREILDAAGVESLQGYRNRVPHTVALGSPLQPESEGA